MPTTANTGAKYGTTVGTSLGGSNVAIANASNVLTSGTSSFARISNGDTTERSGRIIVSGFGFTVPNNAIVTGVTYQASARYNLVSGSYPGGKLEGRVYPDVSANHYNPLNTDASSNLTSSFATYSLGFSNDTKGLYMTPSMVNSPNFGVSVGGPARGGGSPTYNCDIAWIQATVHYMMPSAGKVFLSQTRIAGAGESVARRSGSSNTAWTSPENITAEDGVYSTFTPPSKNVPSRGLRGKSFGFSLPTSNTTVIGCRSILVHEAITSSVERFILTDLYLNDGSTSGNNSIWLSSSSSVGNTGIMEAGAPASGNTAWGIPLTPTVVNSSDFSVTWEFTHLAISSVSLALRVDALKLEVWYETDPPATYKGNGFFWGFMLN